MKKLIIHLDSDKPYYTLPEGMNQTEWQQFKINYMNFIESAISEAKSKGVQYAVITIDTLPQLSDDLNLLKGFMVDGYRTDEKGKPLQYNINDWNTNREIAKKFFTAAVISELDGSGYIKKLITK